jgi:DNA-binding CsgD family transcriptional regulator
VKDTQVSGLFTIRELEVFKLLAQGKTSKEIAVHLKLKITTVASHRKSICRKLGVHSTAGLIRYAVAGQNSPS